MSDKWATKVVCAVISVLLSALLASCGGGGSDPANLTGSQETGSTSGGASSDPTSSPTAPSSDPGQSIPPDPAPTDTSDQPAPAPVFPSCPYFIPTPQPDDFVSGLAPASFCYPSKMASDKLGNLYLVEVNSKTISKISPTGKLSLLAGTAEYGGYGVVGKVIDGYRSAAAFASPGEMVVGADGNLYVADVCPYVRKITSDGHVTTITLPAPQEQPDVSGAYCRITGIAAHPNGDLYVTLIANYANEIFKISPNVAVSVVYKQAAYVTRTGFEGIAIDSQGTIFVLGEDRIVKLINGGVVTFVGKDPAGPDLSGLPTNDGVGLDARFLGPNELTIATNDDLYVVEDDGGGNPTPASGRLRKVTPEGVVTTLFHEPYDVNGATSNPDGNEYFTFNHWIMKMTPAGELFVFGTKTGQPGDGQFIPYVLPAN